MSNTHCSINFCINLTSQILDMYSNQHTYVCSFIKNVIMNIMNMVLTTGYYFPALRAL